MREADCTENKFHAPVIRRWLGLLLCLCLLPYLTSCGPSAEEGDRRKTDGRPELRQASPLLYTIRGSAAVPVGIDGTGTHVFCAGTSYSAYTDAQGSYAISSVPPGHYKLVAQKPGYETLTICDVTLLPAKQETGLPEFVAPSAQLRPASIVQSAAGTSLVSAADLGSFTGKVVLSDNTPPELVRVALGGSRFSTTTDKTGVFSIVNVEPGKYDAVFTRPGYDQASASVVIKANQTSTLQSLVILRSSASRAIVGKVLFTNAKGEMIANAEGATVRIVELEKTVPVGADGTFAIRSLAPGAYTITAAAPNFTLREEVRVDAQQGESPVVLTLTQQRSANGAITGIVFLQGDPQPPFAGTQVALAGTSVSGATDTEGRFNLTGVAEGNYSLVASREKYDMLQSKVDVKSGETTDVGTLTMKKSVTPPKVLGSSPADGERDVMIAPVVVVTVQFSKPMNADSVRRAFSMSPAVAQTTRVIAGKTGGGQDLLEISLPCNSGAKALRFNTAYRIQISQDAEDTEGNSLEKVFTFSFTTGGLRILSTQPANEGAIASQSPAPMVIRFNGRVDASTLNDRNIRIDPRPYAMATLRSIQFQRPTGWTEFRMAGSWAADTPYTVTFGRGIRAEDGTPLDKTPYRVKFRTTPLPQPPTVQMPSLR